MCVIILCDKESGFPPLATLESAESLNADGGGIAWVEDNKVRYEKGINAKQIFELTKTIPLPAIIHFRIASIGKVNNELCHPFVINEEASTDLSGTCESVLFHNGTWSEWNELCMRAVVSKGLKFPSGDWSDSRAMAWLADKFGIQILSLIDSSNKIAVLTPQGILKFGRFVEVEKNLCSNDYHVDRFEGFGGLWKNPKSNSNFQISGGECSVNSSEKKKKKKKDKIKNALGHWSKKGNWVSHEANGYSIEMDNAVTNDRVEESITMGNDDTLDDHFKSAEDRIAIKKKERRKFEQAQQEVDEIRSVRGRYFDDYGFYS